MNRDEYDKMQSRRRRLKAKRDAARVDAVRPRKPHGLYGARLYADQLPDFARCAEKAGAEWLAWRYVSRPGQVFFCSTRNVCTGEDCPADHRALGLVYLLDLILPETMTPLNVTVWKSEGWRLPGFHYDG